MTKRQPIAEIGQYASCIPGRIRVGDSMMQMYLSLAPTRVAMLRDHFEQALVILLCRIKVGMQERATVMVAPAVYGFWIFAAPPLHAPFLLRARNALLAVFR